MNLNFKPLLGICLGVSLTLMTRAQPAERRIKGYPHEALIEVQHKKVSVRIDGQGAKSFDLVSQNGQWQFATEAGKNAFAQTLMLNAIQQKALSEYYQVSPPMLAEKLVARAVELRGIKLTNEKTGSGISDSAGPENTTSPAVEELTSSSEQMHEESKQPAFLWPAISALIGMVAGFFLGRNRSQKPQIGKEDHAIAFEQAEGQTDKKNAQLKQLQKDLASLQQQFDRLYDEAEDRKQFDKNYFTAVNQKIISGFWEAIGRKDEKSAIAFALKATAQLTAITRMRLDIEQSFDRRNIDEISGRRIAQPNTDINAQTNKDSIPDQISTLIGILQKNGVQGLDQTNFQGYTLNRLDV